MVISGYVTAETIEFAFFTEQHTLRVHASIRSIAKFEFESTHICMCTRTLHLVDIDSSQFMFIVCVQTHTYAYTHIAATCLRGKRFTCINPNQLEQLVLDLGRRRRDLAW
jgi:hypothetical protein